MQVGVFKHGSRSRQSIPFLARSAWPSNASYVDKREKGRPIDQPSRNVYIFGAPFEHCLAAIGGISDDPEALSLFEPRIGQIDQLQKELGLCLVRPAAGPNLCCLRPPKPRSIRQAKHSVADSGKANCQAYDDKTHTITRLLGLLAMLRSRTVILPSSSADLCAAVLVKSVIAHCADLTPSAITVSTIIRKRQ